MSQDELARRLGVTRQTVYSWERGIRTAPAMLDLALRYLALEANGCLDDVAWLEDWAKGGRDEALAPFYEGER